MDKALRICHSESALKDDCRVFFTGFLMIFALKLETAIQHGKS